MLDLRAALKQCPIVAILRGVKPDEVDGVGDALVDAGVTIMRCRSIRRSRSTVSSASRRVTALTRSSGQARCSKWRT